MNVNKFRSPILISGLLIVLFFNIKFVVIRFHKAEGHPIGDDVVRVYNADPSSDAPKVAVHNFVNNQALATNQMVNVYIKYSYEDREIIELTDSVSIVTVSTLILYVLTYAFTTTKST
ncbi:MAG: hypothetical protein IPN42_00160 [Methylococcaceae bacterium]|nr:hypothetical protein [Methylococcaceae bacterium]